MMDFQKTLPDFISSARLFPDGFFMQKHVPVVMQASHKHNHVEVMLPVRCAIHFETHAGPAVAQDTELCLLWGQLPHRVTDIQGDGFIYIANLPLQEILALDMSEDITEALVSGQLVTASCANASDVMLFEGWVSDYESAHQVKMGLARTELQCRLRRQCLDGWQLMNHVTPISELKKIKAPAKQMARVQKMIRFMTEHYTGPITVADITKAGGVSAGYGIGLFQKTIGMSMTTYLTKLRLYHAKSALVDSQEKIVTIAMDSGFGSLSRFYEVFAKETGLTPQNYRRAQNL